MNTIRRTLKSMLVVILVLVSISCTPDHGRFVATIQPVCLRYDKYLLEWTSIQTIFYYDIYCKDNSYIAVYRSQGKQMMRKNWKLKPMFFIIIIIQHTNINIVLMITTLILTI